MIATMRCIGVLLTDETDVVTDDEPGSAPFIVAAVAGMDGLVDISSYWVFSDGAFLRTIES